MSSILSWGGGGEHKTTTMSVTSQKDQTTAVEGNVSGGFIAPGSQAISGGGVGVHTEGGQGATTNLTVTGVSGGEVGRILDSAFSNQQAERANTSQLAVELSGTLGRQFGSALSQIGTAATGQPTDWTRYLPLMIGGVVMVLAFWSKK